ncbi:MAG TPA: hypothetical protein VIY48_13435 [Candidatus Paceibacterota bacterium]
MGRKDELIEDTVEAFEEATGKAPNDYEFAEIEVVVDEYIEGGNDCD